jgi:SAM-dependent methyltransferase
MKKTNYGNLVNAFASYKSNPELAEWRLGHAPLLLELGAVTDLTILDFGCGPANFSSVLTERGAKIVGFDIDKRVIEQARLADPSGDYRVYRGLLADELKGKAVDLIIATFSFCLVPDRELRYILRDMRTLLKSGGKLVVLEPNQERAHGIQYANLHYHRKEGVQSGDYVEVTLGAGENAILLTDDIYRTHADYRQLFEEAGFVIEKMMEPRPDATWGEQWEMELKYPPFLLITVR